MARAIVGWLLLGAILSACGGASGRKDPRPEPGVVELPDVISVATTLHKGTVYVARGLVDLRAPVTIEPGTVVKLGPTGEMWAHGGPLRAVGTAEEPIIFTSLDDDTYGGDTGGDGPPADELRSWSTLALRAEGSELAFCRILHGGSVASRAAVEFEGPNVLRDSVVAHGPYQTAVRVGEYGGGARVERNVIFHYLYPLELHAAATLGGNVFHDPEGIGKPNQVNAVQIRPTGSRWDPPVPIFDADVTLSVDEVPLVASEGIVVQGSGVLRLAAGTVLKMNRRLELPAAGALVLGEGALLTSYRDAEHGAPLGAGPAAAGDWEGVWDAGARAWVVDPRFLYSANSTP